MHFNAYHYHSLEVSFEKEAQGTFYWYLMLITPTSCNSTINLCHQKCLKVSLGIEASGNGALFNLRFFRKALLCTEHKENCKNGRRADQCFYTSTETPGWKKQQRNSFQPVELSVTALYFRDRTSCMQHPQLLWNWLRIHPSTKNWIPEPKLPYLKHWDPDVTAVQEQWAPYTSCWSPAKNPNRRKTYACIVLVFKDED